MVIIMKKQLFEVSTTFLGADEPTELYFDTKEKAENFLSKQDNGYITKITAESDTKINYFDGCTYNDLCGWGGIVNIIHMICFRPKKIYELTGTGRYVECVKVTNNFVTFLDGDDIVKRKLKTESLFDGRIIKTWQIAQYGEYKIRAID